MRKENNMKKYKFISLLLIISVVLVSFSGCDVINKVKGLFVDRSDGTVGPEYIPWCCYTILTDSDTYDYGEEIKITVEVSLNAVQFDVDGGTVHISLSESPYYEIVGEDSFSFTDFDPIEYMCERCRNVEEKKSFVSDFTIKINQPTELIPEIEILGWYENRFGDIVEASDNRVIGDLPRFVTDSQGIVVDSVPVSPSHIEPTYGKVEQETVPNNKYFTLPAMVKSYNREYAAGVPIEELIDRFLAGALPGDQIMCNYNSDPGKGIKTLCYFSKDVRFKLIISYDSDLMPDDAWDLHIEELKDVLSYALNSGVITESEYNAEMEKVNNESAVHLRGQDLSEKKHRFVQGVDFEVPSGDKYFNYVADLTDK